MSRAQLNAKETITAAINAGFQGVAEPFPVIMTRDEILQFVAVRYGELFVGFCRRMWQFTIH